MNTYLYISLFILGTLLWVPFSFSLRIQFKETWSFHILLFKYSFDLNSHFFNDDKKPSSKKETTKLGSTDWKLLKTLGLPFLRKKLLTPMFKFITSAMWNSVKLLSPKWELVHITFGDQNPYATSQAQRKLAEWYPFLPIKKIRFTPHWSGKYFEITCVLKWRFSLSKILWVSINQLIHLPYIELTKSFYFAFKNYWYYRRWQKKNS